VSAVMASPAASGSVGDVPADPVRALQHALYRAAKADPGRRFHALMDKVLRRDVLWRAWVMVRSNNGAPGIDEITLAQVEEYGVTRLLDELASELGERRYRPLPARRVLIPKPGTAEKRPLSIPSVRDRIVQAALKIVLEPVFEAGFLPCSFGFGPRRSAHDALQVLIDECSRSRRWVVETDIASCFSAIPHDKLMEAVEERVCDQPVLRLLRAMLRAGAMEDGQVRREAAGTPQGGVITPPTQKATSASRLRWVTGGWSGAGEPRGAGGAAGAGSGRFPVRGGAVCGPDGRAGRRRAGGVGPAGREVADGTGHVDAADGCLVDRAVAGCGAGPGERADGAWCPHLPAIGRYL
jgi:hypothetical protein